jgi:PAS domain S-box-containing protein
MTNLKLLILEDVPFDVELIEREIKRAEIKFSARVVEIEEDYIREIEEFKPDLILADQSLPSFDGFTALEIAKERCPEVPFIFVSGKIGEEVAVDALKMGATDYVLKGNLSKVVPAIERALEEVKEQLKLKNAEDALHKSHWQLTEAQKLGHIGSWEWEIESDTMSYSDELYNIFGIEKFDFKINYNSFLDNTHPDDRKFVEENIQKVLKEEKPFSYAYRILRPDGSIRIVSSRSEVIIGENGQPVRIIGTEQDITERKAAEDKIKASLQEKELLLQEIHHRVKNNLQVISSLLSLQSRHINDPEALEIFKESRKRVSSIALVHEKLYQSKDMASINFADYIETLAKDIFNFSINSAQNIKLNLDLEKLCLNIETAIPCGLIINELLTNSLKHAFPEGHNGEIYLGFHGENNGRITITVADDGIGLPSNINITNPDTFGLQLVYFLNKQIKGNIDLDVENGACFKISFEELEYSGRMENGE